jgi:hypothetical protein
MDRGVDIYQTDTFAKGLREGMKDVDGWNEPLFQPVVAASLIKLRGLKHGQNGSGRFACFQLFEEIMLLKIFLGLFLVRLESGFKDAFDIGRGPRGCSCGSLRYRNRSGRLTHDEGMAIIGWMVDKLKGGVRKPLVDKPLQVVDTTSRTDMEDRRRNNTCGTATVRRHRCRHVESDAVGRC